MRQNGISSLQDVKTGTLEVSGQLGYELKDDKKPLTKEDFMTIMSEISKLSQLMNGYQNTQKKDPDTLFQEVKTKNSEGKNEP